MGWQVVLAIAAIAEGKARRDLTAKSKSFVHWSYDLRHPDNAIGIGHYYLAVAKSTMRSRTKVTSTKYLILASPFASEVASKWQTKLSPSTIYRRKWLILNWLPRMDSNHDKVISSSLRN